MLGLRQVLKTGHNPPSAITLDPRVTKALALGQWRWYLTETPTISLDLMDGGEACKPVSCMAKSRCYEPMRLYSLCGWKVPIWICQEGVVGPMAAVWVSGAQRWKRKISGQRWYCNSIQWQCRLNLDSEHLSMIWSNPSSWGWLKRFWHYNHHGLDG